MAQLKLAEQIIAEKDHDLHAVGYRADMAMMEKEALEDEIAAIKSTHNVSSPLHDSSQQHEGGTPSRVREHVCLTEERCLIPVLFSLHL